MKKSIKILTLVLSLALLCGALVVAAFAEDTTEIKGVKVDVSTDFTGGTGGGSTTGQKVIVPEFTIDNKGSGVSNVVISEYDENSYFSWDYTENVDTDVTAGNYSYSAPKLGTAWTTPASYDTFAGYYYKDNLYYAFDFDIWFPKDVPAGALNFYAYGYSVTETVVDGNSTFGNVYESGDLPKSVGIKFSNDGNGGVTVNHAASEEKFSIIDGAWNHITVIAEPIYDGTTLSIKTYVVLNGTIIDIVTATPASKTPKEDTTYWFPKTVRFEYGRNDKNGNIVNVDNFAIRRLTKDYNGNLATVLEGGKGASIEAWESDLYDADKMPFATPVAYVGDKAYDNLQKAIKNAKEGDTITLCANVTNTVTVDKVITIECGEYTMPNPATADGYVWEKVNTAYKITTTQDYVWIEWSGCTCPLCEAEADETHPGDVIVKKAYLNNTLSSYYEKAGKSTTWSYVDGNKTYTLVGWMDEDTEEIYALDAPITEEMVKAGYLSLAPVIETKLASVQYEKGDGIVYTTSFSTAIANVKAGGTITLLANTKHDKAAKVTIAKDMIIDLNGYVLDAFLPYHYDSNQYYTSANSQVNSKVTTFALSEGKTVTFKGEKEGSGIIFGSFTNDDSKPPVAGTFITPGKNSTINFEGKYLNVSGPQLAAAWAVPGWTININGGYYNKNNSSDGSAWIYASSSNGVYSTGVNINIDNAYYNANIAAVSGCAMTATITNTVLAATAYSSSTPDVTFNVSDTYIVNALKPNKVVLGANCYVADTTWLTEATTTFAEGIGVVSESNKVNHTNYTQTFAVTTDEDGKIVADPNALVFTKGEVEMTYNATTIKGVTVTFKDGETTLGSVVAKAGEKVVGPAAGEAESVAEGWVMATKSYAYTIPADATEDITIDIANVTEFGYTYTAGKPLMYMNFTLQANLAVNLYVQKNLPEGVSNMVVTNQDGNVRNFDKTGVIGGEEHICSTAAWLRPVSADEPTAAWMTMSFEYAGQTLTYKYEHINVTDYAKAVVEIYAEDTEKVQQMTALLQFVDAANKVAGKTTNAALTEYLATLTKVETTIPTVENTGAMMGTLAPDYVQSATVAIWGENAGLGFKLTENAKAALDNEEIAIKVTADGKEVVTTSVSGNVVYTNNNSNLVTVGTKTLTIEILDADGNVLATGTYSLAAYYTDMADTLTEDEKYLIESLYALASIGDTNK